MVRQAHYERNQPLTVRPEPVEGLAHYIFTRCFFVLRSLSDKEAILNKLFFAATCTAALACVPAFTHAQPKTDYPNRPIRVVVPSSAGSAVDFTEIGRAHV